MPLVLRAEDRAWLGTGIDHARTSHLLRRAYGHRHHLLVRDTFASRLPRSTCIGAPPQPLIEGAAVDLLLVQRIHSQALRLAAHQVEINTPSAVALADHCQRPIDGNIENRHGVFLSIYQMPQEREPNHRLVPGCVANAPLRFPSHLRGCTSSSYEARTECT